MRRSLLLVADLYLIAAATICALALRDNLELSLDALVRVESHLALTLVCAVPVLIAFGQDRLIWRLSVMSDYVRIAAAAVVIVLIATTAGFVWHRLESVARSLPLLQAILMICILVGSRVIVRQYHTWRRRDRAQKLTPHQELAEGRRENVLVIGLNRVAELYLESVAEFASDRIAVAGLLGRGEQHNGRLVQGQKILGTPREVGRVLQDLELHGIFVNRIVITMPFDKLSPEAREALLTVEAQSEIKLDFFAERLGIATSSLSLRERFALNPRPVEPEMVAAETPALGTFVFDAAKLATVTNRRYWRAKRALDFVGAAVLLVPAILMAAFVAILLALRIGFPIAFWQVRPGLLGRPFKIYKLRTLTAAFDDHHRRVPDDQRTFTIGTFLRRSRLDELLQLYNILVGQMSFVGPRPLLPIDQPEDFAARLLVRPGLTGWAQVHGGRHIRAIDKAALDVWYVENASLRLDLKILALTVPMILFGERTNPDTIHKTWTDLRKAGIYPGPIPPVEAT